MDFDSQAVPQPISTGHQQYNTHMGVEEGRKMLSVFPRRRPTKIDLNPSVFLETLFSYRTVLEVKEATSRLLREISKKSVHIYSNRASYKGRKTFMLAWWHFAIIHHRIILML